MAGMIADLALELVPTCAAIAALQSDMLGHEDTVWKAGPVAEYGSLAQAIILMVDQGCVTEEENPSDLRRPE
jgi:hypothetical protein